MKFSFFQSRAPILAGEQELPDLLDQLSKDDTTRGQPRRKQLMQAIHELLRVHPESVVGGYDTNGSQHEEVFTKLFSQKEVSQHSLSRCHNTLLRKMLDCYYEAIKVDNTKELQLLHMIYALSHPQHIPFDCIQIICEREPNAVKVPFRLMGGYEGDLPLSIALSCGHASPDHVRYLFQQYPDAAKSISSKQFSSIRDLALFQDMVAINPKVMKEGRLDDGYSVLYQICHQAYTDNPVMKWIIENEPSLVRERSSKKLRLPIHAVRNLQAAKLLIQEYPEALAVADADSCLPLHTVAKFACGEIIRYMAVKYPRALLHRNDAIETPFSVVALRGNYFGQDFNVTLSTLQGLASTEVNIEEKDRLHQLEKKLETMESTLQSTTAEVELFKQENSALIKRFQKLESSVGT